MENWTLRQAAAALACGDVTSERLTAAALARIDDPQGEGVRAFISVYHDWARRQARDADRRRAAGQPLSA
ncbi:amidase, partial [Serratia rubidaea]|nr:amidase [Serratia rubidaea]